jgi:hypothetical protein
MMKLLLVVLLVACSGGGKPASKPGPVVGAGAPVGGIVPAKEIGLQISDAEGTRVMRLLPSGTIVVQNQATGLMTPGGEIKNSDGTLVAMLGTDGTVEIPTFSYTGFKIDADGTLIQDGQPVAKFDANNTLETKLEQNVDKTVAVGDTTQRRTLMFMWAGIVMSTNNMRRPEPLE